MAATLLPDRDVYNVSRLNQAVRALLEGEFSLLWVQGEVSNLSRPSSGHLYFRSRMPRRKSAARCSRIAPACSAIARATASRYWYGAASACTNHAAISN